MRNLPLTSKCIKYLLFVFNLLFVITGIILLSIGATIHGVYEFYYLILGNGGYLSTASFMVAIGAIIIIISFFGCCGAIKESPCMVITFSVLLIVVFIFELAAGISGYVLKDKTEEVVKTSLKSAIVNYNSTVNAEIVDFIQQKFTCCGINNATDWLNIHDTENSTVLPLSCCNTIGKLNFVCSSTINGTELYRNGCIHEFGNFIKSHAVSLGGVGIGIAFVQLIGIVFACHLSKSLKYQSFPST